MNVKSWSGYEVELVRVEHPSRPELETYHNAELHLWLVQHDGRWTFYPEGCSSASGPDPETAFECMFAILDCDVHAPYTDDARRQTAAEFLGDFA